MMTPVNASLPQDVDTMLQDVAQMLGTISYTDIMQADLSRNQIKAIRQYHRELCRIWEDEGSEDRMAEIGNRIAMMIKQE